MKELRSITSQLLKQRDAQISEIAPFGKSSLNLKENMSLLNGSIEFV